MNSMILVCVSRNRLKAQVEIELKSLISNSGAQINKTQHIHNHELFCLEMDIVCEDFHQLKKTLMEFALKEDIDMALMPHHHRRKWKLICFDMDSTLIQNEVIDEMAHEHGVGKEVQEITHMAMRGEIDFDEALKARVSKLKGLSLHQMKQVINRLELTPGARVLIENLKKKGYKTCILSGGFYYFTNYFKEILDIDYAYANELEVSEDQLTGQITGEIVNGAQKAHLLKLIAEKEKISIEDVIAVGDGANDIPMLTTAGLGVAFHAKEKVKSATSYHLNHLPLSALLFFLGLAEEI